MNQLVPPTSLLLYETLQSRKELSPEERKRYIQLQKGFHGEKKLANIFKNGNFKNIIPLFNCLFEVRGKEVQIDCILLTADTIHLLEVKNYIGDYYLENNHIYSLQTKREIYNPLSQLDRTEFLFKQLMNELQINLKVESRVVFINFDFFLYGALINSPMIFPSQTERFLKIINENAHPPTEQTRKLTKLLVKRQKETSIYERFPKYKITELKRGLFCENCSSGLSRVGRQLLNCQQCEQNYEIKKVILQAIAQFHLLFPHEKITTENITNWCGNLFSKNYIRTFLNTNFEVHRKSRYTHYFFKNKRDQIKLLSKKYNI